MIAAAFIGAGLLLCGVAIGLWLQQRRQERWTAGRAEDWLSRHTPVL